jgi:RNA polymerase sigma-70 factor (ECF subfamily)
MDPRDAAGLEPTRSTDEPGAVSPPRDAALIAALRAGDEAAYVALVSQMQASMLRIAMIHCPRRDAAEEVVQETWLAVFEGIAQFEGRSSVRTWIFSILTNRAKSRGIRERRCVPMSAIDGCCAGDADSDDGPAVDADRFEGAGSPWRGHWSKPPRAWQLRPDDAALDAELGRRIDAAIAVLPPAQREVLTLRDVEGMTSEDVRNVLGLGETNQRVILHRARSKVRRALETYFDGDATP